MNKPTLIMLIGLPASGKSSFYNENYPDVYRYSTDDEIERLALEQGTTYDQIFSDEVVALAKAEADAKLDLIIEAGEHIVWDQTNLGMYKRKSVLDKCEDYYKYGVCLLPPGGIEEFEMLDDRIRSRDGKNIPGKVIMDMILRFQMPTITEGFDDLAYFDPFLGGVYHNIIIRDIYEIFDRFQSARRYATEWLRVNAPEETDVP